MANYLTFSSAEPFTIAIKSASKSWDGTLYYSADAATWIEWDGATAISSALHNGEQHIYVRGSGNSYITGSSGSKHTWILSGTAIKCDGNIENLLDYATVANNAHPSMADYCYYRMFDECTSLVAAPELPAVTLSVRCYYGMFGGCENLTTAPELPAITLTDWCYHEMFDGCKSLATAPELPATTLATSCYGFMFRRCTSLISAPDLPSTTLASGCYENMFSVCTSLAAAPKLPATTLAHRCYVGMFSYCGSLVTTPELPATILNEYCYQGMFQYCTELTSLPELPATNLPRSCYHDMFYECNKIKLSEKQSEEYSQPYRIPTSGAGTEGENALKGMFYHTSGTFTGTPEINTTYYMAVPASPALTAIDFYKVINGAWVKCDAVRPMGGEWVKQDEYLY